MMHSSMQSVMLKEGVHNGQMGKLEDTAIES